MKDQFLKLWSRLGAKGDPNKALIQLVTLYARPDRFYHNLNHIKHCLHEFSKTTHLAQHGDELELAIWYHDAIYNTKKTNNEEESAKLAQSVCFGAGLSLPAIKTIYNLILTTKHDTAQKAIDRQLMCDIDLAGFGSPDADANAEAIRKEYAWVPEEQFRAGRTKVLKIFLDRPRIYATDYFYDKYEQKARANLERELTGLNSSK